VDSEGYREPVQIMPLKVDATAPAATATLDGGAILPGVYGGPVSVTLAATDNLSGIDRIEYTTDPSTPLGAGSTSWQTYAGSFTVGAEGTYAVSYRAFDLAGNEGATQSISFAVDTSPPVAWHYLYEEPGLAVVYLAASDAGSGVERIEYVLDNSGHGRNEPSDKDAILTYAGPIVVTDKGKYTVFYRAHDKAGRISAWRKVTFAVDKVKGNGLISDLRSALGGANEPDVVAAKVGERLFDAQGWPDPNNKIKALPDYLAGTVLIRGSFADKNIAGRDIFTFTAAADVDVYVMKNKDSRADFSGWELVETNFPVEPVLYFKGGADVYHKFASRGERVAVPGADVKGSGYGNLVFVKYAESNKAKITSPAPGSTLASGDSMFYACYLTDVSPAAYKWEVKVGEGDWRTISDQPLGNYTLPEVDGVTTLTVRLTVTDASGQAISSLSRCAIANRAHVRLINPAPGEELFTGEEVDLEFQAFDAEGKELKADRVAFYVKERDLWHRLYGSRLRVPGQEGTLYLKAVISLSKGNKQEEVFQFEVVKAPRPWWIYFWPHPTAPCCLGHRESLRPDGRCYGFTADFRSRYEELRLKDDQGRETRQGCVRLDGKESFVFSSGQGSFRVKLTVLAEKGKTGSLTVNGKTVKVDNAKGKEAQLFSIELTTAAEAGELKVSGSKYLSLVDMNVERILPGAKTSPDTNISLVKGLKVIGK
jgi:hypothetical protein